MLLLAAFVINKLVYKIILTIIIIIIINRRFGGSKCAAAKRKEDKYVDISSNYHFFRLLLRSLVP